ncbi:hypothetical protein [Nocardia sp. BMG51109]|uniref:hypothetical protein n=1 Tax=Nocardia sp. BMG51109 TaxID=1056816 RepID=UPI0004B63C3B|nr:hypothetical protein [Nocardia sp. BMG51109]
MSAFTVSSAHIAVLVHAGLWTPFRPLTWDLPIPAEQLPSIRPRFVSRSDGQM